LAEGLDRVVAGLGDDRGPGDGGSGSARSANATRGASGLFSRWDELVGPAIAAHARPRRVQDGRLVVVTDDPAWAAQLRWLESDLVRRISEAGGPPLEGLIVRVRRP
jgi:predicted nucleic acid-binding Zn ribbon protein